MSTAEQRLQTVKRNIENAAKISGRSGDQVALIAVSKKQPLSSIKELNAVGHLQFGENQIQEAIEKIQAVEKNNLHWHFVGHLQSKKVKNLSNYFEWVHSVDSEKLIERISNTYANTGWGTKLLLQVNTAEDPAKYGILPDALFSFVEKILETGHQSINIRGLMTIGAQNANESETRKTFEKLRRLNEQCKTRFGNQFTELSMGMSEDYEIAVEEGATMVRVGTALFGERKEQKSPWQN